MGRSPQPAVQPFIDHVHEFRRRLLVCALFIAAGSGLGYYLNSTLIRLIQEPLGEKLYFTSPTGGFNFIFIICVSFGLLIALPCIVYQILAFLKPLITTNSKFTQLSYPICSVFLAALGVSFAYYISLPTALNFLTNIGTSVNIESLITTEAYYTFALAYLIGFAVLFQLPLVLIIINRITPLKPNKLMKFQRYVIVGSFIIAAILTPTPDPVNQVLMAGPIIVLYQISIVIVWVRNLKTSRHKLAADKVPIQVPRQASDLANIPKIQPVQPKMIVDIRPTRSRTETPIFSKSRPALKPGNRQWSRTMRVGYIS